MFSEPSAATTLVNMRSSNSRRHTAESESLGIKKQADILNSWKEIAFYLHRGVRTVERWERDLHLPVRRPRNKTRSAVVAFRSDLDEWLASMSMVHMSLPENSTLAIKILEKRLHALKSEINRVENQLRRLRRDANKPLVESGFSRAA